MDLKILSTIETWRRWSLLISKTAGWRKMLVCHDPANWGMWGNTGVSLVARGAGGVSTAMLRLDAGNSTHQLNLKTWRWTNPYLLINQKLDSVIHSSCSKIATFETLKPLSTESNQNLRMGSELSTGVSGRPWSLGRLSVAKSLLEDSQCQTVGFLLAHSTARSLQPESSSVSS